MENGYKHVNSIQIPGTERNKNLKKDSIFSMKLLKKNMVIACVDETLGK